MNRKSCASWIYYQYWQYIRTDCTAFFSVYNNILAFKCFFGVNAGRFANATMPFVIIWSTGTAVGGVWTVEF